MALFDEIGVEKVLRLKAADKATEEVVLSIGPAQATKTLSSASPWVLLLQGKSR